MKYNLIGISGKIGAGKDLVGMIIHALHCKDPDWVRNNDDVKAILNNFFSPEGGYLCPELKVKQSLSVNNRHYETKKFADKLKDITCLLIGCTREQLEDREFKEKELGEDWFKTVFHIQSNHNQLETFFDREEAVNVMSHWDENYQQEVYIASEDVIMTPRLLLQLLGTEAGRQIIHPNIWVNSLFADYTMSEEGKVKLRRANNTAASVHALKGGYLPNWIVTDMRFPNELEAIKSRGGLTIRLERPQLIKRDFEHASETALDNAEFDVVIQNDGTINELIDKVREVVL